MLCKFSLRSMDMDRNGRSEYKLNWNRQNARVSEILKTKSRAFNRFQEFGSKRSFPCFGRVVSKAREPRSKGTDRITQAKFSFCASFDSNVPNVVCSLVRLADFNLVSILPCHFCPCQWIVTKIYTAFKNRLKITHINFDAILSRITDFVMVKSCCRTFETPGIYIDSQVKVGQWLSTAAGEIPGRQFKNKLKY